MLLAVELAEGGSLAQLADRPLAAGALTGLGVAAVAALAVLLRSRPELLPPLAVAALPFRVPVEAGSVSANLLVPLYLVIAAGGLAYAYDRLRPRSGAASERAERRPGALQLALVTAVALYALQATYSTDLEQALKNVVFFYVPFALLLKLLIEVRWTRRVVMACLVVALGLAAIFVAIGFGEFATRRLLWNPKVIQANQLQSYFRVNSLFFDPNIYGRFLAIVMLALTTVVLWGRRTREPALAAAGLAVLWAGLLLTFSQSSITSLLAGLIVLGGLRWRPRPVAIAAGAAVLAAGVAIAALPGLLRLDLESERAIDQATSGRFDLMRGGVEMFAARPLWGFGSGSFAERFREREGGSRARAVSASHTIPITVAAEQGALGLAAYGLVVVSALALLFGGLGRLHGRDPPPELAARAAVAAAFTALTVHTLLYAAFLEDPLSWSLLAAGIALRAREPAAEATSAMAETAPVQADAASSRL